jgi:competence protein CoiA
LSTLSPDTLTRRTEEYTRLGIYVLWLLQWTPKLDAEFYSPRPFERWLHAAYFGRVYFWKEGLTVIPYRFTPHQIHVEKRIWYDTRGNRKTAGGYRRLSKRRVAAVREAALNITQDFEPTTRNPFNAMSVRVPRGNILVSRDVVELTRL